MNALKTLQTLRKDNAKQKIQHALAHTWREEEWSKKVHLYMTTYTYIWLEYRIPPYFQVWLFWVYWWDDVAADLNYPPVRNIRRSTDKILSDKTFLLNGSNPYEWESYHLLPKIWHSDALNASLRLRIGSYENNHLFLIKLGIMSKKGNICMYLYMSTWIGQRTQLTRHLIKLFIGWNLGSRIEMMMVCDYGYSLHYCKLNHHYKIEKGFL